MGNRYGTSLPNSHRKNYHHNLFCVVYSSLLSTFISRIFHQKSNKNHPKCKIEKIFPTKWRNASQDVFDCVFKKVSLVFIFLLKKLSCTMGVKNFSITGKSGIWYPRNWIPNTTIWTIFRISGFSQNSSTSFERRIPRFPKVKKFFTPFGFQILILPKIDERHDI